MASLAVTKEYRPDTSAEATVFVVDDDPEARRSLTLLARSVNLNVETFASAGAFLENYDASRLGCLVLGVRMSGMNGLELQKKLAVQTAMLPIIFITAHGEIAVATQAMRAGALDFFEKPFSPHAMLERIQEAIELSRDKHHAQLLHDEVNARMVKLSVRECEVMHLVVAGECTKVIAARLGISPKTVDNHRAKIFKKMDVENAVQLARFLAQQ